MWNAARVFFALWYLGGAIFHVYLGTTNPRGYAPFGQTILIPQLRELWYGFMLPQMRIFAYLLAAFEMVVGLLILSKGKWVKLGLTASLLFNLFLIQLGLATVWPDPWASFVWNRLPNLAFAVGQMPLFWKDFQQTLPGAVRSWFRPSPRVAPAGRCGPRATWR